MPYIFIKIGISAPLGLGKKNADFPIKGYDRRDFFTLL